MFLCRQETGFNNQNFSGGVQGLVLRYKFSALPFLTVGFGAGGGGGGGGVVLSN